MSQRPAKTHGRMERRHARQLVPTSVLPGIVVAHSRDYLSQEPVVQWAESSRMLGGQSQGLPCVYRANATLALCRAEVPHMSQARQPAFPGAGRQAGPLLPTGKL